MLARRLPSNNTRKRHRLLAQKTNSRIAALGVRVKSGYATAVLLAGPVAAPKVIDLRRIDLSDPAIPESRQPYHAGFGRAQANAAAVARLTRIVTRCAQESFGTLLRSYGPHGRHIRSVGIVVGSTIDPETIANQHIRAHAAEGRLFRTVVERAAQRRGLRPTIVRERDVYAVASRSLRRSQDQLRRAVAELGRAIQGPWRADEKTAAAAAWLVLASHGRRGGGSGLL